MTIKRDENDPVGGPAQQMASLFETSLMTTLAQLKLQGFGHPSNHLYVTAFAISSAIQIAGKLLTMPEGDNEDEHVQKWATEPVGRDALLLACLLVARCVKPNKNGDGYDFEFGPTHILAAIKAAEQLLGHNIDDQLAPGMVKVARKQPEPKHIFDNTDADVVDMRTLH